jgi:hypothetical protein
MPISPKDKSHSHFVHYSVRAKAKEQDRFTRHQNVERYRRLLKTATDPHRHDHLVRLILKAQQKKKDVGDSDYQY